MRCYVLGLLLLGSLMPSYAQTARDPDAPVRFRHLAVAGGPGEQNVYEVFQDSVGFLWFGTDDGLFRFDGVEARAFRPVPFDTTSLSDPWAWDLEADGAGGLWVTTVSGGLNRYDPASETFQRYPDLTPLRMKQVLRDADGTLWIGTSYGGVVHFDPRTKRSEHYTAQTDDSASLPDDRIEALLLDRAGVLWVGTWNGGLARLDPATRRFRTYRPVPGDPGSLPAAHVRALHEDRQGRLWVGTAGGGVVRFDPSTDTFVRYPLTGAADPRRDDVYDLLEDPAGALWIGSAAGLDRFDPETGRSTSYRHALTDPASIGAGIVYTLYLDHAGVLWIGREFGVSYFEWDPSPFEHYTHDPEDPNSLNDDDVFVVYEDGAGVLWAGTGAGLNRIDRDTGRITRYAPDPSDPTKLASGTVMGINETDDGSFWVTSRPGGLHRFDRATGRVVERFTHNPGDPMSVQSENPWWILEDRQGRTWITNGGEGCLNRMDRAAGTFTPVCHDPDDPDTPAHDFARYFIQAQDGTLWLGTWGAGLDRIDPDTGRYTHYRHDPADRNTPSSDFILFLGEGDDGVLWLGTFGSGFSRFDPATETFTHYTEQNSDLPNNTVYGIQPDDAGHLWLSTNSGLARFDPATEAFRIFEVADGLQSLEFNSGSSFRSSSGELFFGGVNGFNAFHPDRLRDNEAPPAVVVTRVSVEGRSVGPEDGEALDVAAPLAETVRLAPGERDVAFGFAALHFVNPARNRYRYRLEGYDADWHTPEGAPEATYTNLDPGRYTLRVQAANSDGVWNREGASLAVVVAPRWFETWWFKLSLGLALLALVAAVVRQRIAGQRRREAELHTLVAERTADLEREKQTTEAQAEQLRELDAAKSRFFANVSHEFRTPLTLTIGPLEDLRDGLYPPDEAGEPVDLALRNAHRVLDLVNEMLDLAKLDAGEFRLHVQPLDLDVFLRTLAAPFAPHAERIGLAFGYEGPERPVEAWLDPNGFGRAVSNLLSNAFKFTPAGGSVRLRLTASDAEACVTVEDTGVGIEAGHLPHLFDRFYQADGSTPQLQPGTGIGLAFAREIVTLHGGTITVESEPDAGSLFTLTLPLGPDHLDPSHRRPEQGAEIEQHPPVPAFLPAAPEWGGDGESTPSSTTSGADDDDVTTILVVDDHPDIRAYVRRHLQAARDGRSGYRVIEAADGAEGLRLARERLPDLVVSDVMMPVLDGLALCAALKADPATDFLPVILLTAKAGDEATLEGLESGADAYVTKPFNVRTLAARVDNLIAGRRRLRERFAVAPAPPLPSSTTSALAPEDAALLDQLRAVIEERLGDEDFGVEALAEAVGMSRATLYRRLKGCIEETPQALLREARLARAVRLLTERAGGVGEIAYAVGFKSVAHFSRAFRATYGVAPSAYVAQAED